MNLEFIGFSVVSLLVHQVKNLGQSAIKVKGISEAVKEVQRRQSSLGKACFKTEGGFTVAVKCDKDNFGESSLDKFIEILNRLSNLYNEFPRFMIDIMAE